MGGKSKNPDAKVGMSVDFDCPDCDNTRICIVRTSGITTRRCISCAAKKSHKENPRPNMDKSPRWKGGRHINNGYVVVYISEKHPFFSMARANKKRGRGGHILEHRLIMAEHLGRILKSDEIVHHINGDKEDNRIGNLKVTERKKHKVTYQDGYRDGYNDATKKLNKKWDGEEWTQK